MVDTLHKNGIAVIVDVVFNHTSNADNALGMIDSEYYFTGGNKSGCGNDTYCSRPMMRKLILDSLSYWLSEYHIDGFRFDLSHLIDQKNLFTPENIAKLEAVKPIKGNLILIGEDWSNNRAELKGTTVARWNDYFRNDIKNFISKGGNAKSVPKRVRWSKDKTFYADPMETVNYVESHDEETIANRVKEDGWKKSGDIVNRAKMAGLILFTSQGIPMILEGQEVMRDKQVQLQDYESNVFNWDLVKENAGFLDFYKKFISLRMKNPVLRLAKDQPDSFYKSLKTNNRHAAGYVLNADSSIKNEPKIVVLLNPSKNSAKFNLPDGKWKVVADEKGFYEKDRKEIDGEIILEEGEFILGMQK
jgi:pullulanase